MGLYIFKLKCVYCKAKTIVVAQNPRHFGETCIFIFPATVTILTLKNDKGKQKRQSFDRIKTIRLAVKPKRMPIKDKRREVEFG